MVKQIRQGHFKQVKVSEKVQNMQIKMLLITKLKASNGHLGESTHIHANQAEVI
uniref:Uncharacterized protein n=1 Tax=Physcomitrium patens TaxID=3218 RepID=A0A2K1INA0_PHYPA|nr:hypothetical protein PHYPA_027063 [Physcomitrium patens]